MLSFRNVSAIAFFLFGTTFLWMTASFVGRTPAPRGSVWTIVNVLAVLAISAYGVASWGVWKQATWWEPVAVGSAIVGLVALAPYVTAIAAEGQLGDQGVLMNIGIHSLGSMIVLVVALVPAVNDWFTHRWA